MTLTKEQTIQRLCSLVSKASVIVYGQEKPHDCFCGDNKLTWGFFQMNEEIISLIERAVMDRVTDYIAKEE